MPNLLLVSHSAASSIYDEKFKALTKEKADSQAQVDAVEQAAQQDQNSRLAMSKFFFSRVALVLDLIALLLVIIQLLVCL